MPKVDLPNEFVVFDLEYTAWEGSMQRGWNGDGEYREIYDIGAVLVRGKSFEIVDQYRQLVRLKLVSRLPQYSVDLTGITQQEIDEHGVSFGKMLKDFKKFTGERNIYAWGYDGDVLIENCELKNVECLFSKEQFFNMREVFKRHGVPADDYQSSSIVTYFGETNKHTAHQGLDDAQNIVEALKLLQEKTTG